MASLILPIIAVSFIGLLPIAFWLIFFLWQDIKKPEPLKWILILFSLGVLISPLVWFLENYFLKLLKIDNVSALPFIISVFVCLVIALIEELTKFFTANIALKKNKYFDEAIDAMIYLIVLSLGFGTVENILVSIGNILNYWQNINLGLGVFSTIQIISLRFIGANLLHALSAGIIGYFWALKLIYQKKRYLNLGLFLGILLHWLFNIAIIKLDNNAVFIISIVLFLICIFLLWAFDILKQIKKPIEHKN